MIALTRKAVKTLPFSHYLLIPSLKKVNMVVYLPSVMFADINGKNRYRMNVFRLNWRTKTVFQLFNAVGEFASVLVFTPDTGYRYRGWYEGFLAR